MPSTGLSSSRRAVAGTARPADVAIVGVGGGMDELSDLLVRGCAAIAAGTAAVGGSLLLLRRLTQSLDTAPPFVLLAAAMAGTLLVLVSDLGQGLTGGRTGPLSARIGMLLGVLALAVPPAATLGSWGAAGVALAATLAVALRPLAGATVSWPRPRGWRSAATVPPVVLPSPRRRRRRLPGSLRQRYERYELPTGGDCVRGRLAIAIPAGARAAAGHIGFCPAFAETPEIEVTTAYDGVEVTVTAAEVLPWGVRVECRLAEPAEEPLEIPVDILARVAGRSAP